MKLKRSLILLTIAGVTAAVAIPVSILAANKVKKDNDKKNIDESSSSNDRLDKLDNKDTSTNGGLSKEGEHTETPVDGNTPKEGEHAETPADGSASTEGEHTESPADGNTPKEGEHAETPADGNTPKEGEHAETPADGNTPKEGEHAETPADGSASTEGEHTETPADGNTPKEGEHTETPADGSASTEGEHTESPADGNTPKEGEHTETPVDGNTPKEGEHAETPADGSASTEGEHTESPADGNTPKEGEHAETPADGSASTEGEHTETPEDGDVTADTEHKDTTTDEINIEKIDGRDEYGYYKNLVYDFNGSGSEKELKGVQGNSTSLFDNSYAGTEYYLNKNNGGGDIAVGATLTISLPSKKLISKVLVKQGKNNNDVLSKFDIQYLNSDGTWTNFNKNEGTNKKLQLFVNEPVETNKVRIINKAHSSFWLRMDTFKVGYENDNLDDNGYYLGLAHDQNPENPEKEVQVPYDSHPYAHALDFYNDTYLHAWKGGNDESTKHKIVENATFTVSLPKKQPITKVFLEQGLSNPNDILSNFEIQYKDQSGVWVPFSEQKGNNTKTQTFVNHSGVITDKIRILNKTQTDHWFELDSFKVGYDKNQVVSFENASNFINATFTKGNLTWNKNENPTLQDSNVNFNVTNGLENRITNITLTGTEVANNQIFAKYSFKFDNQDGEGKYLVATKADFRNWNDKFVITRVENYEAGATKFRVLIKDPSITYENVGDFKFLPYDRNGNYSSLGYVVNANKRKISEKEFYILLLDSQPYNNGNDHTPYRGKVAYFSELENDLPIRFEFSDDIISIDKKTGEYTYSDSLNTSLKKDIFIPSSDTSVIAFGSYLEFRD
ncbi:hypothetical protein KQ876_00125 [Mycoplasma sp. CSL7491-lung]|uniref:hypothetical protein n=1 Tax=Mycoplasma sp. CSL7491-lung TaxID=549718 RepID=UPI001C11CC46|nr:hypothetical protein [Mycoplasma sp. CSL7491-lung]MBU4692616.1 hypothetical protein [Mycoplasma sp. CSL7491-lung]